VFAASRDAMPPICATRPVGAGAGRDLVVVALWTATFIRARAARTIIANVVSCPWPCENEPVRTIAPPSGVISTSPSSASPSGLVIST
jgi:hypothetical protein